MSNFTEEGIADVKTLACDALLTRRVEEKMRGRKAGDVLNRLTVTLPKPRDGRARIASVPPSVLAAQAAKSAAADAAAAAASSAGGMGMSLAGGEDDEGGGGGGGMDDGAFIGEDDAMGAAGRGMVRAWLERDRERVGGGPGVYRADTTRYYLLRDDSWKTDIVPEVLDGKNVADFVDPDILERLLALEAEEEGLLASESQAFADEDQESEEDEETAATHKLLLEKKSALSRKRIAARNSSGFVLPNSAKLRHKTAQDLEDGLLAIGYNAATAAAASAHAQVRGRKREREGAGAAASAREGGEDEGGEDEGESAAARPVKKAARSASAAARNAVLAQKFGGDAKARVRGISKASRAPAVKTANADGFEDEETRASNLKKQQKYRSIEFHGSKGEKDHIITAKLPKWLFSGKMGFSRDRR